MVEPLPRIPSKPDRLLRWDQTTGDVYILRQLVWSGSPDIADRVELHTNVPQELWLWPRVGYGWGAQRREGATLALGILDRHIPPRCGEICDEWHFPLCCNPKAFRWAAAFQEDFLHNFPSHGGRIAGDVIRQWIAAPKGWRASPTAALPPCTLTDQWPVWLTE